MLLDKLRRTLPQETRDGERGGDGPGGKPRAVGSPSQVGVSQPRAGPTGPPVIPDPLPCPQTCPSLPTQPCSRPLLCPAHLSPYFSSFCVTNPGIRSAFAARCSKVNAAWMLAQRQCLPSPLAALVGTTGRCLGFPRAAPKPCLPLPAPRPAFSRPNPGNAAPATWFAWSWKWQTCNLGVLLLAAPFSVRLPRGDPRALISALFQGKPPQRGWEPLGPVGTASRPPAATSAPAARGGQVVKNIKQQFLFTKIYVLERKEIQFENESLRDPSPAQPTGPARSPHFIATSPSLLKAPRPSRSSAWLLHSTKIVFPTMAPGAPWPPCPQAPAKATASPTDGSLLPKLQESGHRQDQQPTHRGCSGLAGPSLEMHFFFQQHAVTVTNSRRTGTSIYDTSRVKQTTGWRRGAETPANLRGGLGRAHVGTGTTETAPAARLRPSHRLPPIKDAVGVAMLPLPVAPMVTAGGKHCSQDRG